jgi:HEAT repeat protein
MHISEIGLCGGHSSSGVWVDANARTTVPGLYAAGDLACVPHNYMIGAFVFGDLAGADAASSARSGSPLAEVLPEDQIAAAHELIYRPLRNPQGPPQTQVEYKLRRFVNDYVAPPKTEARLMIALEAFARMETEIAAMGARSPHELMRCAEVTFIRDCAELAARASLVRAESRWGLYHQRADRPGRDDDAWFWHLNVRRGAAGTPEFVKRAVAPYRVPVAEFTQPERDVTEVILGDPIGAAGPSLTARGDASAAAQDRPLSAPGGLGTSARLPELLRLAETSPSLADLGPFLQDPDPRVRRAAVGVLAESVPAGAGAALASAALDSHGLVRHAAAAALRELAMVLPSSDAALLDGLRRAAAGSDPVVRCAALDALGEMGAGDDAVFSAALGDADHRVRLSAVRGLARLGDRPAVAGAACDASQQVRIGVAGALAAIGDPGAATALRRLAADQDPHVRAAAFTAAGALGCPSPLADLALAALRDQAWQVRAGAAQALGAAPTGVSKAALVTALADAAADPHPDVRKAAVIALAPYPDTLDILRAATDDSDADVRAYARRALADALPR